MGKHGRVEGLVATFATVVLIAMIVHRPSSLQRFGREMGDLWSDVSRNHESFRSTTDQA